jgi:hypothetical protein
MYDLWFTKWNWDKIFSHFFSFLLYYSNMAAHSNIIQDMKTGLLLVAV